MIPTAVVTFGATPEDVTCLVETATIRHGRDDPTTQPEADAATVEILGPLPAGVDIGTKVTVSAVLAGTSYPRFVGEITDLQVGWDSPDVTVCQVVAVGLIARMGYRTAGTTEYPLESDGGRVARAVTAAGVPTVPVEDERTDIGTLNVLARTPDPQPALQIAQEAAEDGGGVLWQAKDGVVLYADAGHRQNAPVKLALDPCIMPLDLAWQKSLEGLVNDIRVTWGGEGTDGEGGGGGDGGGSCCGPRETLSYTTPALEPGGIDATTINLAPSYRLLRIETDRPARIRFYTTPEKRDADLDRLPGPPPIGDHGLLLDITTAPGTLAYDLTPTVDGFDGKPAPDGAAAISITNLGLGS